MKIEEVDGMSLKDFKEIESQLNHLANRIIEHTIDLLKNYFYLENKKAFIDKVNKARRYKNGYILKKFLKEIKENDGLTPIQYEMLDYLKMLI